MKIRASRPRRLITLLVVIALAAVGAAGCGSAGSAAGAVVIWVRPGLFSPETLQNLKTRFPDVPTEVLETPDVEPKLRAALRARSGIPDIVMLGGNVPDYYAAEDSFVDLRDYGWGDVQPGYLDWKSALGTSTTGRVIAVPLDTGPYAFLYRADVLDELGIPSDPASVGERVATWDGYRELARAVAATGRFVCDEPASVLTLSNNQVGFSYFEKTGDDVVPIVDSPVLSENFLRAGEFASEKLCANVTPGTPEWNAAAAQNTLVGLTGPIYNQNGLKESVAESAGRWRVTSTPGGPASAKGSFLAVTAASQNPSRAAEIAYWLSSSDNQTLTFRDIGAYPSTPASLDDDVFLAPDPFYGGQVIIDVLQPVLESAPRVLVGPFGDNISAIFKDTLTDLAVNGGDPRASYRSAVTEATSAVGR